MPKSDSLGCIPALPLAGDPSASLPFGFVLQASNRLNNKTGTFFCSLDGPSNLPFSCGFLCVQAPLRRTRVPLTCGTSSGNDCTGVLTRDFNARIGSGVDPRLVAGLEVGAHFCSRDLGFARTSHSKRGRDRANRSRAGSGPS